MKTVTIRFANGKTKEVAADDLPRLRNIFPSLKVVNAVNTAPDFQRAEDQDSGPGVELIIEYEIPAEPEKPKKKVTKARKRKQ